MLATTVTLYNVSVAVHVIAVVVTLGVTYLFGPIQVAATKTPRNMPFALHLVHRAENTMVWPGIVIILVTGIYQTTDRKWMEASDHAWLTISLVLFVAAIAISAAIMRVAVNDAIRFAERDVEAAGPSGDVTLSGEFDAAAARIMKVGPLLGAIVVAITFLMIVKPF